MPNPAIYHDLTYWKELQRRNAIGTAVDLEWWRQEHPRVSLKWWRALTCSKKPAGY